MLALMLTALLVPAQDSSVEITRSEELQAAREDKAQHRAAPQRSSLENALIRFKENRVMERFRAGFLGFHPLVGGMESGSGFALGASREIKGGLSASARVSFTGYQKYELAFSRPSLLNDRLFAEVRSTYRNHPQEAFYGIGSDTRLEDRADYRLEDHTVAGQFGVRLRKNVKVGAHAGWIKTAIGEGTSTDVPSVGESFPPQTLKGIGDEPTYLRSGAFLDIDSRDEPGNARAGGYYTASWSNFQDRNSGRYDFTQYDAEIQQYIPFFHQRRVIALRAKTTLTQTAENHDVPFYMMPTLGGSEDLRGFADYRFRDRNMVAFNAEYRWEAFSGMDVALFADAGQVAPRVQDIRIRDMKTSAGFGFRFNTARKVFCRIDVGFSREETRIAMKFGHVF